MNRRDASGTHTSVDQRRVTHTHTANTNRAGYVYMYRCRLPGNTKHCVLSVKNVGQSNSAGEHSHCSSPRQLRLSSPVSAACLREHGNLRSRTLRLYFTNQFFETKVMGDFLTPSCSLFFFSCFFSSYSHVARLTVTLDQKKEFARRRRTAGRTTGERRHSPQHCLCRRVVAFIHRDDEEGGSSRAHLACRKSPASSTLPCEI